MKIKLMRAFAVLALSLGLIAPLGVPAFAENVDEVRKGVDFTCTGGSCGTQPAETKVGEIIATIINILSIVVGVVAVIMIIIGGLKYITSSGDSANITSAKNTILYAIIGLVVVALAQIIVRFVLDKV
jgi:hypothetical protein